MFSRLRRFLPQGKQPATLVEYIFVDRRRLVSYAQQLGSPKTYDKLPSWSVGISGAGPSVGGSQSVAARPLSDHEMIKKVRAHLINANQLKEGRPEHHHDTKHGPFWVERMTAQKVIFPVDEGTVPGGVLKEIAVWVSEPPQECLTGKGYSEGTFLYLIEGYWRSDEMVSTTMSGFSALAYLMKELSASGPPPEITPDYFHHRDTYDFDRQYGGDHPLVVMKRLGGSIEAPREIESLYRLRYLTDEQFFSETRFLPQWMPWAKRAHRSNDAFGYPIYVASI